MEILDLPVEKQKEKDIARTIALRRAVGRRAFSDYNKTSNAAELSLIKATALHLMHQHVETDCEQVTIEDVPFVGGVCDAIGKTEGTDSLAYAFFSGTMLSFVDRCLAKGAISPESAAGICSHKENGIGSYLESYQTAVCTEASRRISQSGGDPYY